MREVTVNHAERQNLNVRLFNRRFNRLTLGFSEKFANLQHPVALGAAFHNFCRTHKGDSIKISDFPSKDSATDGGDGG